MNSCIQTNFSRLSDNSECNCLKAFEKLSQHLWNSLIMLEIGWKLFGNCFEIIENLSIPLFIFGRRREIFGNLQKLSEIFGDLRKSFENFGNLLKALVNLRKFRFCEDEKSRAFY